MNVLLKNIFLMYVLHYVNFVFIDSLHKSQCQIMQWWEYIFKIFATLLKYKTSNAPFHRKPQISRTK